MAELIISGGHIVTVDDEDGLWVASRSWRLWRASPAAPWQVVSDETRGGRRYRARLGREVYARAHPKKRIGRVRFRDGDHLNCRRDNLEATVAKQQRSRHRA